MSYNEKVNVRNEKEEISMTKKEYVTPIMTEEVFEADEYVAACWGVACAYGVQGKDDGMVDLVDVRSSVNHRKHSSGVGCGYETNQYIVVDDNGKVSMIETGTDNLGHLACTITDAGWNNTVTLSQSDLNSTSVIYWTTSAGNRTWHHMGYVNLKDGNSSNHS